MCMVKDELCILCHKTEVAWPRVCDNCCDKEAQKEIAAQLQAEGEDPEDHRCRTCGMIYDGGMRCTYCGDSNPLDGDEEYEDLDDDA